MHCSSDPPRRGVVFDLDDTLYLERDYVLSGFAAVGAWARTRLGVAALEPAMRALFEDGLRGRVFDAALVQVGHAVSPDLIARMLAVYRQHRPRIALAPDAARYLARREGDVALAVVTDGYLDAQRRKVRALQLHRGGVRLAVCTDRWGRAAWKPHRRAFDHVQRVLGLPPERLVYVADNPAKDFDAPRRLGWRTVRIVRPEGFYAAATGTVAAERTIASLDALE